MLVEHVDGTAPDVGGIEEIVAGTVLREREAGGDRPGSPVIHGQDGAVRIDDHAPGGDGAVDGGEQEAAGGGDAVRGHWKAAAAVEDGARGAANGALGGGDGGAKRDDPTAAIEDVAHAAAGVSEPER